MNKEFTRMQKLAGIITEGLYTSDAKAPMEAVSHDGESKMKKSHLKKKIKEMMTSEDAEGETGRRRRMYFHVLERGGYDDIKWQGVYNTKEEAQKRAEDLVDMFPRSRFYVESSYSRREPVDVTMEEGTIGQEAYAEMGSIDEASSDYTADAYKIAKELIRRMPFPDALFRSKELFLATIKALQDELYNYAEDQFGDAGSASDEYDDYDDSTDVYDDQYPDMAEGRVNEYDTEGLTNAASVADHYLMKAYELGVNGQDLDDDLSYDLLDHLKGFSDEFSEGGLTEAKKDKESDTEDVIVADTEEEVPAEGDEDRTVTNTKVDVNMDGVPDVDTGSAESKKAFTSLVDTYNSAKELGDPKLTQMIANALTYYNKNIILKVGQPQA